MKVIAANKRANFDYEIIYKVDAGIVLTGAEVKSLRTNTGSIRGSFVIEKKGELWLTNCYIKKYNNANQNNYDPNRGRKLKIIQDEYADPEQGTGAAKNAVLIPTTVIIFNANSEYS